MDFRDIFFHLNCHNLHEFSVFVEVFLVTTTLVLSLIPYLDITENFYFHSAYHYSFSYHHYLLTFIIAAHHHTIREHSPRKISAI